MPERQKEIKKETGKKMQVDLCNPHFDKDLFFVHFCQNF